MLNALRSAIHRSLGTRFSVFIGALLLPLFAVTGLIILQIQSQAFTQLTDGVGTAFSSIRELDTVSAKNDETARIEKLGKLMAAIAPSAIASYDFMALLKYAETATETPGVCEVIYKSDNGSEMAKAKSKTHTEVMQTREFDIINDGAKLGSVVIGYNSALLDQKLAELDKVFKEKREYLDQTREEAILTIAVSIALFLLIAAIVTIGMTIFLFRRFIGTPIQESIHHMQQLAEGNMEVAVCDIDRHDEIGAISAALCVFKTNAQERELLQKHEREKEEQAKRRADRITHLCSTFDNEVRTFFADLEAALASLESAATELQGLAQTTTTRVTRISDSSNQVNESVSTVAHASEDLTGSIREISQQINASNGLVKKTAEQTSVTAQQTELLMSYAQKVNAVLDMISAISHQTRLLSLNATIEAERAGDMGKGFAVVAGEVRVLAAQTEDSVKKIQQTITDVQTASSNISMALEETKKDVDAVHSASGIMASAAEKQSSVTASISSTMRNAAQATNEVADSLSKIVDSATKTNQASSSVNEATSVLSNQARELRLKVEAFLQNVKNA